MCATYNILSLFTHEELAELHLSHQHLKNISNADLVKLAQFKLERFIPKTPEQSKIKTTFAALLLNIGSCIAYDALKQVNWSDIIFGIVEFIKNNS